MQLQPAHEAGIYCNSISKVLMNIKPHEGRMPFLSSDPEQSKRDSGLNTT